MSDTEITFSSGDVTLHGSMRIPVSIKGAVPAVLLLAGSGPTDRNGDSSLLPGQIGTLRHLADVLEDNGFASLRYDKLGSGTTGLGPYDVEDVADLGFSTRSTRPGPTASRTRAAFSSSASTAVSTTSWGFP